MLKDIQNVPSGLNARECGRGGGTGGDGDGSQDKETLAALF